MKILDTKVLDMITFNERDLDVIHIANKVSDVSESGTQNLLHSLSLSLTSPQKYIFMDR